jgi:3-oxoacyl-[acyl-carrier-protein] synthase-3
MPTRYPQSVGIGRLAYRLPRRVRSLRALKQSGRLRSELRFLNELGFSQYYAAQEGESPVDWLTGAGQEALDGTDRAKLGAFFLYSGLGAERPRLSANLLTRFRYPVAELAHRLELDQLPALAVGQQGCSGLLSTIDLAARMLQTAESGSALCLAGDALPRGANREVMYNLMSDGAAAALVERGTTRNRLLAFHQLNQASYWDSAANERELIAAYFPMAKRAICIALEQVGLDLAEIRWLVPSNVSRRSWLILADLLGLAPERIWMKNIPRVGHTVSCDHIINLVDMERQGDLRRGDHLLLFTFGFGASWTSMLLEH